MNSCKDLTSSFQQLISIIKDEIHKNINNKSIKSVEETHDYWKIDTFEYNNENGSIHYGSRLAKKTTANWIGAAVKIYELIKKSSGCSDLIQLIESRSSGKNIDYIIRELILIFLENQNLSNSEVEKIITTLEKYIKNESIKIGVTVKLNGIVIVPKSIELNTADITIILRQPISEDIEKYSQIDQIPAFAISLLFQQPSAILNIEFLGRGQVDTQIAINKAICVLQLFKVGGIVYSSYNMYSESLIHPIELEGIYWQVATSYEKSIITYEDVPELKRFLNTMEKIIPQSFYALYEVTDDYVTIAYKRYCDALLQSSVFERKILNAVMGLEAIFLKEEQELNYRLSIRVAKVFGKLGYNPSVIKVQIRKAYRIRSLFVHGQYLSNKERNKLISEFKNINSFAISILDYLRISIIIMIHIKMGKEDFLVLLDNALIDNEANNQLQTILSSAKEILS